MTQWITTPDGVRIAYHELGAGDPAIILIHGGFGDRGGFGLQEEYFSPNHRCIAVDLRGHGESDKPDEIYTMEQHGDDVADLIRQLGSGSARPRGTKHGGTGDHLGRRPPSRTGGRHRQPRLAQQPPRMARLPSRTLRSPHARRTKTSGRRWNSSSAPPICPPTTRPAPRTQRRGWPGLTTV